VKRKRRTIRLRDDQWHPWSKIDTHICCDCNMKHTVEIKVDKRGVVWMKWTKIK